MSECTRPRRERRHPAALAHASDQQVVLWCSACRSQIKRFNGQVSVTTLALAEVTHSLRECQAITSPNKINEENNV